MSNIKEKLNSIRLQMIQKDFHENNLNPNYKINLPDDHVKDIIKDDSKVLFSQQLSFNTNKE